MSSVNAKSVSKKKAIRTAVITRLVVGAILTAMSVVLMYLEVSLTVLFIPPFLKFDFSEVPVLVGSFALGPFYAVIIELLKNLIHLPVSSTAGIGELSNFLVDSVFVFTAGFIYKRSKTRKTALIAMLIGTLALTVSAVPINWFINLPLYEKVLHFSTEAVVGMSNEVNPLVKDKLTLILWVFIPFNIFKGIVVSFITFWIYKPISNLITRTSEKVSKKG